MHEENYFSSSIHVNDAKHSYLTIIPRRWKL